ncbi:hypothetical protein ITQ94_08710 [Pediococcus pentosaceus]|uniref:hypothetical protein n=1 Tax=Pediococcus pentosaceus TaxID=1255 RepID=UPI0018FEFA10|nr:hypothetical protein [Pediococcus pentosaceus]MBF7131517.1 hypothetical protein [Pediococcus pentosaceus]
MDEYIYILAYWNKEGYREMDSEVGYYNNKKDLLSIIKDFHDEKIDNGDPMENLVIIKQPLNKPHAVPDYYIVLERDWSSNQFIKGDDYDEFMSDIEKTL